MICPKIFQIIQICAFFFYIDFSCYLFVGFLGSICKFFWGGGAKYINFRAKIIIIIYYYYYYYLLIYKLVFFFQTVGGGGVGGGGPITPSTLE